MAFKCLDSNSDTCQGKCIGCNKGVARPLDIITIGENDVEYQISIHIPGVKKDDFLIELRGQVLTIVAFDDCFMSNQYNGRPAFGFFESSLFLDRRVCNNSIRASFVEDELILIITKENPPIVKEILIT